MTGASTCHRLIHLSVLEMAVTVQAAKVASNEI
jgi:hypothetical protein